MKNAVYPTESASAPRVHITPGTVADQPPSPQKDQGVTRSSDPKDTVLFQAECYEGHGSASEDAAFTQRKRGVRCPGGPPPNPILSPMATAKFWARWFGLRTFPTETAAISEWNNAVIDMAAAALGITRREAVCLKDGRAVVVLTGSRRRMTAAVEG